MDLAYLTALRLADAQAQLLKYVADSSQVNEHANAILRAADSLHDWACYPGAERLYAWALLTAESSNAVQAHTALKKLFESEAASRGKGRGKKGKSDDGPAIGTYIYILFF